jgi:hypothetical protein
MAGINTLILNQGIGKAIDAQNNSGFHIKLTSFGISETAGLFDKDRNTANTLWFKTLVTSTVKIDDNTIQLTCAVPPNAIDRQTNLPVIGPRNIGEVYVYGEDENLDEFVFALGQPEFSETYDPQGSYEMRIQLKLLNVTVDSVYKFFYTQAEEVGLHNESPIAHANLVWDLTTETESFSAVQNKVHLVRHAPSESLVEVTLPQPELGKKFCIKDGVGDVIGKRITLLPNDGELIDQYGAAGYTFKFPYEAKTLMSDGTDWFFIWSENQDTLSKGIVNLGDPNVSGSWRLKVDGGKLFIQKSTGLGVFEDKDILE